MNDKPIFIFSASWRTGSTLVQRIFNATGNVLIWGEPKHLSQIKNTYNSLSDYFLKGEWQYKSIKKEGIGNAWTPILSPKESYLIPAYKQFFEDLYLKSAQDVGYSRWGFKEVRENAYENALFLKKIFPDAKFIFNYRNPFDMFESVIKTDFYKIFKDPYSPVKTWVDNVNDVLNNQDTAYLNFFILKHEDLINSEINELVIKNLFEYAEVEYDLGKIKMALQTKVGGSKEKSKLTSEQINNINDILGSLITITYPQ